MAELMLHIGNSVNPTRSQDGDIVHAANDRKIKFCHAETICHPWKTAFNRDGLRPADSLPVQWYEITHEFKFQRVSNSVLRTNLFTGEIDILSEIPNAKNECIDVALFLKRRLASPNHVIFGTAGNEFWYGGHINSSDAKLNKVWEKIEELTPLRLVDHSKWPVSDWEKQNFLNVMVDDFTDEEATAFEAPVLDENGMIVKKHQHHLPYADIADITARVPVDVIRSKNQAVEIRFPDALPKTVIGKKP